jgi:ribosomal protein S18 acetylase RimI-like enzyme
MISVGSVQVVFRSAVAADTPAIVALVESAYRGDSSRKGWTTEADLLDGQRTDREQVQESFDDPSVAFCLATLRGVVVGSVCVRVDPPGLAHIGMFAVSPALQRAGLGSALLVEAEQEAVARGAQVARMTVIEQRPELLAWYGRRGYRDTGEREPFPYGDPRFGLPRRDDLRFVVLRKSLGLNAAPATR